MEHACVYGLGAGVGRVRLYYLRMWRGKQIGRKHDKAEDIISGGSEEGGTIRRPRYVRLCHNEGEQEGCTNGYF